MAYSASTVREGAEGVGLDRVDSRPRSNESWSSAITSGRVTLRISLQPSSVGAAEVVGGEVRPLQVGAGGAVEHQDALAQRLEELGHRARGYRRADQRSVTSKSRDPTAAVDPHGVVGAGRQLAVAVAVAVRPDDDAGRAAEPLVEPAGLLGAADVRPRRVSPVRRPSGPTSSSVASTVSNAEELGDGLEVQLRATPTRCTSSWPGGAVGVEARHDVGVQVLEHHQPRRSARRARGDRPRVGRASGAAQHDLLGDVALRRVASRERAARAPPPRWPSRGRRCPRRARQNAQHVVARRQRPVEVERRD